MFAFIMERLSIQGVPMTDSKNVPGKIEISPTALTTIAHAAIERTYGVVGLAAKNVVDGIANALTRESHKGVNVHIDDDGVVLDVYVILEYGTNLKSVSDSVITSVRYSIESTTGIDVKQINVHVQGLRVSTNE